MSGIFIQSRYGARGNFEVVVPSRTSPGLVHFFRDNDKPNFPWSGPTPFGEILGNVDGASLIQTNFITSGTLEVVASAGGSLFHFSRDPASPFNWHGPVHISDGVTEVPGLIQSRFGLRGNFEVVVPASAGGLLHFWRDNDDPSNRLWSGSTPFGDSTKVMESVSLIQSNFGNPGNLEVVASDGFTVSTFWRDSGGWNGPFTIVGSGIIDSPSLILGSQGDFEMVAAVNKDISVAGIVHFTRNNDKPGFPWSAPDFVVSEGLFFPVSLIQSNFGSPGNLELVAVAFNPMTGSFDGPLDHFYRDSGGWNVPIIAATAI